MRTQRLFGGALGMGLGLSLFLVACSDLDSLGWGLGWWTGIESSDPPATGSIGIHLDLAPGIMLTSATWKITNGTNTYSGVTTIGDVQSFEFVQGGIVAAAGYTVSLSGIDSVGDLCAGTSPSFAVMAGAVTEAALTLTCTLASDATTPSDINTGTAEIDASIQFANAGPVPCPGISSFSINPAGIDQDQTATVTVATIGPAAQIAWSVSPETGGTFGDAGAPVTTFTCAKGSARVPQVTITATVSVSGTTLCEGQRYTSTSAFVNCLGG